MAYQTYTPSASPQPIGVAWSSDGTKFYVLDHSDDAVEQYTAATAWSLAGASYASKRAVIDDGVDFPGGVYGFAFSADGYHCYAICDSLSVHQYDLSTAWDISTASYASKSKDVSAQDSAPYGIAFKPDGSAMYLSGYTPTSTVYQYALSTAWDVSTASYASKSKDVSADETSVLGIAMSATGADLYITGGVANQVQRYVLTTAWDISTAGSAAPTTGTASGEISVTVVDTLAMVLARAAAAVRIDVRASGTATGDIAISVAATTGSAAAAVRIDVRASGTAAGEILIGVVDSLDTTAWSARVVLDGADVSARVAGRIEVDAEEGAARIARFDLVPESGAVNPIAWTGRTVVIDLLRAGVPARLFTGRVDMAEYDPVRGRVAFSCTDDLQNRVAALTVAEIDALTAGRYSTAVFGDINDRWDYAKNRMSTRAASIDAGRHGGLRVTDWDGLATWRTFTEADILDTTPRVVLPRRAEIVNRVTATFQYRYHRLRERRAAVGWSMSALDANAVAMGWQYPDRTAIESALSGTGWLNVLSVFSPAPATVAFDEGYITVAPESVATFTGTWALRYAQPVTETHTLVISAPTSVAANGEIGRETRGSLASNWDPADWEASLLVEPAIWPAEQDHAPDAPRADAEEAMRVLLDQARATILASHRHARVSFTVTCLPEADLHLAAVVDTSHIEAAGKLYRVRHWLDVARGEALTEITLALSGVAAGGIVTPDDLDPPAQAEPEVGEDSYTLPALNNYNPGLTVYAENLMGWLANTPQNIVVEGLLDQNGEPYSKVVENPFYTPTTYDVTGFRAQMPGVSALRREPITPAAETAYSIAIPEDTLTLTA